MQKTSLLRRAAQKMVHSLYNNIFISIQYIVLKHTFKYVLKNWATQNWGQPYPVVLVHILLGTADCEFLICITHSWTHPSLYNVWLCIVQAPVSDL